MNGVVILDPTVDNHNETDTTETHTLYFSFELLIKNQRETMRLVTTTTTKANYKKIKVER
jgi:hypothetical protein